MPIQFLWSEVERLMDIRGIGSREDLARLANIHSTNLHKISKGTVKPSLPALGRLCAALQCQPGDILRFQPDDEQDDL